MPLEENDWKALPTGRQAYSGGKLDRRETNQTYGLTRVTVDRARIHHASSLLYCYSQHLSLILSLKR
jgi:hypothetical protein